MFLSSIMMIEAPNFSGRRCGSSPEGSRVLRLFHWDCSPRLLLNKVSAQQDGFPAWQSNNVMQQ